MTHIIRKSQSYILNAVSDKRGFGCRHTVSVPFVLKCVYTKICVCVWVFFLLHYTVQCFCGNNIPFIYLFVGWIAFPSLQTVLSLRCCSNTVVNTERRQYPFDTCVRAFNLIPRLRVKVMRPTENEKLQFMVEDAIEKRWMQRPCWKPKISKDHWATKWMTSVTAKVDKDEVSCILRGPAKIRVKQTHFKFWCSV